MKVLVFCEFSGVVLDAFLAEGHDAYSADLLPTESAHTDRHFQGDGRWLLREPWDLVIAHPPCRYLAVSRGAADFDLMADAITFFRECQNANAPAVAVENPLIYKQARKTLGQPHQKIEPFYFGDPWRKRTFLWLKRLPRLSPTNIISVKDVCSWGSNQRVGKAGPARSPRDRSRTFPGIAAAMARQWGNYSPR